MKKIKKVNSGIISIQNRLKEAEKERKKFQSRIPFILHQGKKIPKKIAKKLKKLKNLFPTLFLAKTGMRQAKKKRKILVSNSIHTQTELENSKKNSKKIQKIKKVYSGIISIQNGLKEAEKERKKFQSRIPFIPHQGKKIAKKIAKKFKNLKNLFPALFLAKTGKDRPRKREKNFSPEFR